MPSLKLNPMVLLDIHETSEMFVNITLLLIAIGILMLIGRWIYFDAKSRGSDWAWQWATGVPFLFVLGVVPGMLAVVIYLLVRGDKTNL